MRRKSAIIIMLLILSFVSTEMTFSYWASQISGNSANSTHLISIGSWIEDGYTPVFEEDDFIELVENHTPETKIVLMNDVEIAVNTPFEEFDGILDGNGYTLTNTSPITGIVSISNGIATGLFSKITANAEVSNIIISNIVINANFTGGTNSYAAPLAAYNEGTISNVAVKGGTVTASHSHSGSVWVHASGLVGENKGIIENSYSTANVTLTVDKTTNNTDGTIHAYAGGLVGKNVGGIIRYSYATGSVTGNGRNAGTNSNNEYRVVDLFVGGLVGNSDNGTILSNFATGTVIARKTSTTAGRVQLHAGRIVGNLSGTRTTNRFLSTQSVTAPNINTPFSRETLTNANQGTSALATVLYNLTGDGLSTWDREIIWRINAGAYPTLRMEED